MWFGPLQWRGLNMQLAVLIALCFPAVISSTWLRGAGGMTDFQMLGNVQPLAPPPEAGAPAGPAGAPAPGPAGPAVAALPPSTTPDPDPWADRSSSPLGFHPRTVQEVNAVKESRTAHARGDTVLDYAKNLDMKLRDAAREHARLMNPFTSPPAFNFTEYWPHARPFAPRWLAPPMAHDTMRVMRAELDWAATNVSQELPAMLRNDIMDATHAMIERLKSETQAPTVLPTTTTTTTTTEPPPPPPPAESPAYAPSPAGPGGPGAPGAPGAPGGTEAPTVSGFAYVMGIDGNYYKIPLSPGITTTAGPTTPTFTTTPSLVMGANGLWYAAPVTPALVMGADGRYYSSR